MLSSITMMMTIIRACNACYDAKYHVGKYWYGADYHAGKNWCGAVLTITLVSIANVLTIVLESIAIMLTILIKSITMVLTILESIAMVLTIMLVSFAHSILNAITHLLINNIVSISSHEHLSWWLWLTAHFSSAFFLWLYRVLYTLYTLYILYEQLTIRILAKFTVMR